MYNKQDSCCLIQHVVLKGFSFTVCIRLVVPGVPWHPQILADQYPISTRGGGRFMPPK